MQENNMDINDIPEDVYNFLILACNKHDKWCTEFVENIKLLKVKISYIDETEMGQQELTSVNDAIDNTPVVLVFLSKEYADDEKMKEIFCMILQSRFDNRTGDKIGLIPVYCPCRRDITYYDQLPYYIRNKTPMEFDPDKPEKFLKKLQENVLDKPWYKKQLRSIIKNLKGSILPNDGHDSTENSGACHCVSSFSERVTAQVRSTASHRHTLETVHGKQLPSNSHLDCSSMIAECASQAHGSDISDLSDANSKWSSDDDVISENVLNTITRMKISSDYGQKQHRTASSPDTVPKDYFINGGCSPVSEVSLTDVPNGEEVNLGPTESDVHKLCVPRYDVLSSELRCADSTHNGTKQATETECSFNTDSAVSSEALEDTTYSVPEPLYLPQKMSSRLS